GRCHRRGSRGLELGRRSRLAVQAERTPGGWREQQGGPGQPGQRHRDTDLRDAADGSQTDRDQQQLHHDRRAASPRPEPMQRVREPAKDGREEEYDQGSRDRAGDAHAVAGDRHPGGPDAQNCHGGGVQDQHSDRPSEGSHRYGGVAHPVHSNHRALPIGKVPAMRALLVCNPKATTTSERARDVLVRALRSETDLDVEYTRRRGHAITLAREARKGGADMVVALGGDGTVNEVVNGLLHDGTGPDVPALAVVSGGSTNVFARALGLPMDWAEGTGVILEAIRAGRSRQIGLGRADDRYFTFCAGYGLDAEVIQRVERARLRGRKA